MTKMVFQRKKSESLYLKYSNNKYASIILKYNLHCLLNDDLVVECDILWQNVTSLNLMQKQVKSFVHH